MTTQGPCSRNYVDSVARLRIALVSRSSLAVGTARAKGPLYRVFGGRADRYGSQRADKISALLFHLQFAMPHVRQANIDRSCVTIRCVNRIRLPFEVLPEGP